MSVALWVETLAHGDTLTARGVPAGSDVSLVHRGCCLFDLEEEWISAVTALEQHEEHPHPDAAHAHHLSNGVGERESVEQVPPVLREGL